MYTEQKQKAGKVDQLKGLAKRSIIKNIGGGNELPTKKKDAIQQLDTLSASGAKVKS